MCTRMSECRESLRGKRLHSKQEIEKHRRAHTKRLSDWNSTKRQHETANERREILAVT